MFENEWRGKGPSLPNKNDPAKFLSTQTVRTFGGHLNQFFDWCSKEGLIRGRPIELRHPPKKIKIRTAIPSPAERVAVEQFLQQKLQEWAAKDYRLKNCTVELDRWRTLLRIFMLGNYAGLRRGEIWCLPLRNIHLDEKRIYIMPLNKDGGTDKYGKLVHVKFRPKAGDVTDFNDLSDYLMEFLREDLGSRNGHERWFLDKGDGSLWYASPDGITKGIGKVNKELGLKGGAIHWFRKARLDEIWKKSPNHAKQYGRHNDLSTTEGFYQSGEKPSDMIDLLNEIDRSNKHLN